jgi:hypothetical protein
MEKEIEYASLEWAKEKEVGGIVTRTILGQKWDIQTINDLDDQLLRERATEKKAGLIMDFKSDEYKVQLLLKCIVKPHITRDFVTELRRNKLSGRYSELVSEVMKVSGINIDDYEMDKEKN